MKKNLMLGIIAIGFMAMSCQTSETENRLSNAKVSTDFKVMSISELGVQSLIEHGPATANDPNWADDLKSLREFDSRLKSELFDWTTFAKSDTTKKKGPIKVLDSCCPCNGVCCGCVDYDFTGDFIGPRDLEGLILTSKAGLSIQATNEKINSLNIFRFNAAEIANGEYTMVMRSNVGEVKFDLAIKDSKLTVKKEGFN
ncbi:MAG TPA: hypothetical protein VFU05_20210 [Cyclobacteriaceae bacterium]|nr:hypothetical protein [Cyclobacteriaceae bacterium]